MLGVWPWRSLAHPLHLPERIAISAIEAIGAVQDWRVSESYWPSRG